MTPIEKLRAIFGAGSAADRAEEIIVEFEARALSYGEAMETLALACRDDVCLYFYERELMAAAEMLDRHPGIAPMEAR